MLINTIFSGFGGQGVLSMGSTLATAAMLEDKYVTYLPAYGVEVRGGTANCTVVVSDEEIASPVASEPEYFVAMNQPSFARFQSILQAGGLLLANSSLVNTDSARSDIEILAIPTSELAGKLGTIKVANMIMLGALIRASGMISYDTMLENLKEILGEGKGKLIELNRQALGLGYNYAKDRAYGH
jgi:2-oxoglutarate ferredoxin oxidoreductase subunit gamma